LRRGPFDDEWVEYLGTARGDDDGVAGGKVVGTIRSKANGPNLCPICSAHQKLGRFRVSASAE
jgi:hypothetical protein